MKLHTVLAASATSILALATVALALPAHATEAGKPAAQAEVKPEPGKRVPPHSHAQEKTGVRMPAPTDADHGKQGSAATDMSKHHHPRDR